MDSRTHEQTRILDAEELIAAARAEAELTDFGDDQVIELLTRWVASLNTEARLSPMGAEGTAATITRILVNRLRLADALKRHPEILEEDVSDPIVIVGLPRTGTTKLQRLIASDPGMQRPELWRVINPAPLGPDGDGEDPRIAFAEGYVSALGGAFAELLAAHNFAAREAEEELHLMEMGLECFGNFARWRVPSYQEWVLSRPAQPTYDLLRRFLQFLQWQDGGRRGRPWALKSPVHLGNIDVLLNTFPNATVVQTHRDVATTIPSLLRLLELTRYLFTDEVDLSEHGRTTLTYWAGETARNIEQRKHRADRILDVHYEDLRSDPIAVIERIYAQRGHALTAPARQAMARWAEANPQHRHGVHKYSLEAYGLTPTQVSSAFADYSGQPPGA